MTAPDGAQSGDGTPQGGAPGSGTGPADPGASGAGTQPDGTTVPTPVVEPQSGKTYTEAEMASIQARMVAADKRAADFETKLKQLVDKDLPELDKLKRDLAETTKVNEASAKVIEQLRIENAFHSANKHEWHDANVARSQLDMTKVAISSDGQVTGMDAALDALAKSHPYLLKPSTPDPGAATPPPIGTPPANNGGQPAGGTDKATLQKRFPALRNR